MTSWKGLTSHKFLILTCYVLYKWWALGVPHQRLSAMNYERKLANLTWHLVCLSIVPEYNRMVFALRDYLIVCVTWCGTKTQFQFELEAEAVVTFNIIADSLLFKTRIWGYKTHSNQMLVSSLLLWEQLTQMYLQFSGAQNLCLNLASSTCYTLPNTGWVCEHRNYSTSHQVSVVR